MFDSSKLPPAPGEYFDAKKDLEEQPADQDVQETSESSSEVSTDTAQMQSVPDINYVERANVVVDNVSKRYVISQGRSSDASMTRVSRGKTVVDAIVDA